MTNSTARAQNKPSSLNKPSVGSISPAQNTRSYKGHKIHFMQEMCLALFIIFRWVNHCH